MSKTRPLFTVVMPAYGVEKYLAKAVESIESQTFQEWELIIVEDGSPDKTGSLAEKLLKDLTSTSKQIEKVLQLRFLKN